MYGTAPTKRENKFLHHSIFLTTILQKAHEIVREVQPEGSYFYGLVVDATYHNQKFVVRVVQMWR